MNVVVEIMLVVIVEICVVVEMVDISNMLGIGMVEDISLVVVKGIGLGVVGMVVVSPRVTDVSAEYTALQKNG
ncbi:hypothetical protein L2E82_41535 [Cichorium intybus]|uniref:Uncharacterized protein n=1 Tax=Cichorium intybus TaxID=13427 RepID=A0ACB9AN94_CICIN|nr:hypothetical protein L2E82_41535 [Cichorium intybus]